MTHEADKEDFDEKAVLEELERLRGAIGEARLQREAKVAEFESFVRTCRITARVDAARAAGVRLDDDVVASALGSGLGQAAAKDSGQVDLRGRSIERLIPPMAMPTARSQPDLSTPLSRLDDLSEATAAFPDPEPRRWSQSQLALGLAGGLLVLVLVIAWSTRGANNARTPPPVPAAQPQAAPAPQPTPPGQPGATAGASGTTRPLQIELTTIRPVWMRVTVDDQRVVERQVPSGERLQFGADRTILIRAGDAGAVHLSVDGKPAAPMGPAGQIVNQRLVPSPR